MCCSNQLIFSTSSWFFKKPWLKIEHESDTTLMMAFSSKGIIQIIYQMKINRLTSVYEGQGKATKNSDHTVLSNP